MNVRVSVIVRVRARELHYMGYRGGDEGIRGESEFLGVERSCIEIDVL